MKNAVNILIVLVVAGALAALSSYFITGWFNTIPWIIAGLSVGFLGDTGRKSIVYGAVFGYVLFLVYIWLGYQGKTDTDSLIKFTLFDIAFSLVGGLAGAIGGLIGSWLKKRIAKTN